MTDDTQLAALLRSALPPVSTDGPSPDLWPAVTHHSEHRSRWSWFDIGLAVVAALTLAARPDVLLALAYHF